MTFLKFKTALSCVLAFQLGMAPVQYAQASSSSTNTSLAEVSSEDYYTLESTPYTWPNNSSYHMIGSTFTVDGEEHLPVYNYSFQVDSDSEQKLLYNGHEIANVEISLIHTKNKKEVEAAHSYIFDLKSDGGIDFDTYFVTHQNRNIQAYHPEPLPLDYGQIEKVEIPATDLIRAKAEGLTKPIVKPIVESALTGLETLEKYPQAYRITFASVRFTAVTGAVYSALVMMGVPHSAALLTGLAVGGISGTIQYHLATYMKWLARKGYVLSAYKALAKLLIRDTDAAQNLTPEEVDLRLTNNSYLNMASEFTKWYLLEVVVLGTLDVMLRLTYPEYGLTAQESIASILLTSALATAGQGVWDVSITRKSNYDNAHAEAAVTDPENKGQLEILNHTQRKIKFKSQVQILGVAMGTNFGAVLDVVSPGAGGGMAVLLAFAATGIRHLRSVNHNIRESIRNNMISNEAQEAANLRKLETPSALSVLKSECAKLLLR